MTLAEFEYHHPATVDEACALLQGLDGRVAALAGGTELLLQLRNGDTILDHMIALSGIQAMTDIRAAEDELVLGAMVTPGQLARSAVVRRCRPELVEVVGVFAATQVGNRATIGGNIATAVPSADFPPLLIACGATCTVVGPAGSRSLPVEATYAGPRQTALGKGELITQIRIRCRSRGSGASYVKFALRDSGACAVAGAAAWVSLEAERIRAARVVLSAVAPVPLLVDAASEALVGEEVTDDVIERAALAARTACQPIADIRGSIGYRRDLVETLTRRALVTACDRARYDNE